MRDLLRNPFSPPLPAAEEGIEPEYPTSQGSALTNGLSILREAAASPPPPVLVARKALGPRFQDRRSQLWVISRDRRLPAAPRRGLGHTLALASPIGYIVWFLWIPFLGASLHPFIVEGPWAPNPGFVDSSDFQGV